MGIETLAATSLAASAGSGILGAFGASGKADAEAAAYEYKAGVARNNAILAQRKADESTQEGAQGGQVNDLKTKNLVGTQLVTQAANGLDVNSGTNVTLRESTADLGKLDTLTILHNALKKSAGFKAQASNFESEAELDQMSADNAKEAGKYAVVSSLLGGATSFSDKWAGYKQKGVF